MAPAYQLYEGRSQQRYNGLYSLQCQTLQFLPLYYWCLSSCHLNAGARREWVWVGESICGFHKRNCLGLQQPPLPTQYPLVFAARSCGDLSSWHWNPGLGAWCGSVTPHLEISLPNFYPRGCEASPFRVRTPPTSLHGCSFFNSVVVRLPVNSISDVPDWWWFRILVILMMMLEEASHVCLYHHLDWKPQKMLLLKIWGGIEYISMFLSSENSVWDYMYQWQ